MSSFFITQVSFWFPCWFTISNPLHKILSFSTTLATFQHLLNVIPLMTVQVSHRRWRRLYSTSNVVGVILPQGRNIKNWVCSAIPGKFQPGDVRRQHLRYLEGADPYWLKFLTIVEPGSHQLKRNLCGPTLSPPRGNFHHVDVDPHTMLGELELPKCSHDVRLLMLPVDTPAMAEQLNLVASLTNPLDWWDANHKQWRTQKGGLGGSPPEKFWNFRLKNARFLSFEIPYPMYFHGWCCQSCSHNLIILSRLQCVHSYRHHLFKEGSW